MQETAKEQKMQLQSIFEVVRIKQEIRALEGDFIYESFTIRSPEDCAVVAKGLIGNEDREVFLVICLNTKNKINAIHRAHIGSINSSVVHPREIFKSAVYVVMEQERQ